MTTFSRRRTKGTSLIEVPVTLWVFIFLMMFPLIDLVTLTYRATLAYFCVRDATYKAALQHQFDGSAGGGDPTQPDCKTTGTNQLSADQAAWSGISFSGTTVSIVQVNSSNTVSTYTAPISTVDPNSVYLIRINTTAAAQPLLRLSGLGWSNVPGITGPVSLNFQYQVAAEYPQGLTL